MFEHTFSTLLPNNLLLYFTHQLPYGLILNYAKSPHFLSTIVHQWCMVQVCHSSWVSKIYSHKIPSVCKNFTIVGWYCFHVQVVWLSKRHNCVVRWLDCGLKEMGSYVSKTFHTKFTNFASLNFIYVQRFHLHLLHLWGRNSSMVAHTFFLVSCFYVELLFLWTMLPTHVFVVGQKDSYENGGDTQAFLDGNNGPQQQHGLSGIFHLFKPFFFFSMIWYVIFFQWPFVAIFLGTNQMWPYGTMNNPIQVPCFLLFLQVDMEVSTCLHMTSF